ncbi:sigma-70 family RNA polymerase sigma factor [Flavobacteriaceae bacterium]|nr:sigma-70 family RNA polymerase sigma factor [Flavobacteriaceae bacterium]
MKHYNIQNYIRYKQDLKQSIKRLEGKDWEDYTRDELVIKFLPLVENLARKFSTAQQASGVMDITDLIQDGSRGLIAAVDKIIWKTVLEAEDPEKRLKSFLSKRIKGAIRRAIDINRGTMRIPEHKINEIRKNNGEDRQAIEMFFNSVFTSLDAMIDDSSTAYDVPDNIKDYNPDLLTSYLMSLLHVHLTEKEAEIVILSYGLHCDKLSAKEIANKLKIKGDSAYVRVSQLKRQAIDKLIDTVEYSQVVDFL